jgi:hypothetical protein
MSETSSAESTLKRLTDAEAQARAILSAAQKRSEEMIAKATEQAAQSTEAVGKEIARLSQSRREEAESQGAALMKERLEGAETEARELERRANGHLSEAVGKVVDWVTYQEE